MFNYLIHFLEGLPVISCGSCLAVLPPHQPGTSAVSPSPAGQAPLAAEDACCESDFHSHEVRLGHAQRMGCDRL